MVDKITMGNKLIGKGEPVFIIAEAGVNHNGQLELAEKLVDVAVKAGVDAVKFQTFKAEEVATKNACIAGYQEKNVGEKENQQMMLKNLELDYRDFKKLKKYCDRKEIIFLSTPHSVDAIDFLEDLVPAYKIGSGDLTNIPFLKKIAVKGKPVILGAGMSTIKEIKEAVDAVRDEGNDKIIVLHCTTSYPCPPEEVNLRAMLTMQKELDCLVGYSDHTSGIMTPVMAATLGAVIIEKHFTLDKSLPGPDHKASLEPQELKELVEKIRDVEAIMGSDEKKPTESEKEMMRSVRKSIVAAEDIPSGVQITEEMLAIKRPGTGITPKELRDVVGRFAKKDIKKDRLIEWSMIK